MKYQQIKYTRQRGVSLVEMGIAAAIVAVILVGALLALQKVQMDRRLQKARQEVPATILAISQTATTQTSTYGWATTQTLSMMDVWPNDRVENPGMATVKVNGPFPGSTERVFANAVTAGPRLKQINQGFAYWLSNIPAEACMPLLQLLVTQRSVAGVYVGAASTNPSGSNAGLQSVGNIDTSSVLSLNMATAAQKCAGNTNKSIVAFISRV